MVDPKLPCKSCSTTSIGSYSCLTNFERLKAARAAGQKLTHVGAHRHAPCKQGYHPKQTLPDVLTVMRHSERVDELFPDWIERCVKGYKPYDMNMPEKLPWNRPVAEYDNDTPITVTGHVLASMIGRGFSFTGNVPDVIYCSPATRCIQTAMKVRAACGSVAELRIEPGLFENTSLYKTPPLVPTLQQLDGLPIAKHYSSFYQYSDLFERPESIIMYNERIHSVLKDISRTAETTGDGKLSVLVVAHASTVDMAVGAFRAEPRFITEKELEPISTYIPYCCLVTFKPTDTETKDSDRTYALDPFAMPPVTYKNFCNRYDVNFLNRS